MFEKFYCKGKEKGAFANCNPDLMKLKSNLLTYYFFFIEKQLFKFTVMKFSISFIGILSNVIILRCMKCDNSSYASFGKPK